MCSLPQSLVTSVAVMSDDGRAAAETAMIKMMDDAATYSGMSREGPVIHIQCTDLKHPVTSV